MRDELNNTETSLSTSGVATLAAKLVEGDNAENLVYLRQGRITAVSIGGTTTKISATVNNQVVANIVCTSGWKPVVNDGVWILDTGSGRWLAIGGSSRQQQVGAENIAPGTFNGAFDFTGAISASSLLANNITLTGAETIRNSVAGAYMTWYNGGTRIGYLQGNPTEVYLNGESGTTRIRGGSGLYLDNGVANYQLTQGVAGNRVVATDGSGYIWGNYVNMTADLRSYPLYMAGQDGDNFMRWYTQIHSSKIVGGDLAIDGQFGTTKQSGSLYYTAAVYLNAQPNGGGAVAAIGFHPGGVAGQIRMGYNVGIYHFGNVDSSGYYEIRALVCTDVSSQRYKQDIRPWPPASVQPVAGVEALAAVTQDAISILRQLQVVSFRQDETQALMETPLTAERNEALQRLNNYKASKGEPAYPLPIHVCSPDTCGHTPEDPCVRVVNWQRGFVGFIAEHTENVFPEAVTLDEAFQPSGISSTAIAALNTSAIQQLDRQLTASIEENNRRITALEKKVAQMASYPPMAQYLKGLPA